MHLGIRVLVDGHHLRMAILPGQCRIGVERFHLAVHHETTSLSIYELVVAKNGPKMKTSGSTPNENSSSARVTNSARDGFPVLNGPGLTSSFGPGTVCHLTAQEQPISNLARVLSGPNAVNRTVIDKTGLAGKYDFTLFYDLQRSGSLVAGESNEPTLSVFDAVQQQLGLKLVNVKAAFDRVVVDHAEKMPIQN